MITLKIKVLKALIGAQYVQNSRFVEQSTLGVPI
jgi:hypothetical protein